MLKGLGGFEAWSLKFGREAAGPYFKFFHEGVRHCLC